MRLTVLVAVLMLGAQPALAQDGCASVVATAEEAAQATDRLSDACDTAFVDALGLLERARDEASACGCPQASEMLENWMSKAGEEGRTCFSNSQALFGMIPTLADIVDTICQ